MKKIAKFISVVLIIAAVVFLLHFILTLNAVDTWLTEKLRPNPIGNSSLIYTEWEGEQYELEDTDKPCIFAKNDRLYLTVGRETADITPEDINIAYYSGFMDFNDVIHYKKNCIVSEDGRYIIYRLEFDEIPYLYYFDTLTQKAFFISDRVDSFDIVENDKTEALTLIYATGYSQMNKLFLYRSDATGETAGKAELISENNKVSGVIETYGSVVYLDLRGQLYRYDPVAVAAQKISDRVENLYFPGDTAYNYDQYYEDFTICCRKDGKDYIMNGTAEAVVAGGYYNMIPKYTFRGVSGDKYYYSLKNKRMIRISGETETVLYEDLGDLYHVFLYLPAAEQNAAGSFIVASGNALYLLREDGGAASELMKLPARYRKHVNMLENHMKISPAENGVYYVNLLTSGSLVLNTKRAESWLNIVNSYNYGLIAVRRDAEAYTAEPLAVPPSRRMHGPVPVTQSASSDKMSYISYYANGNAKAVSLLSAQGTLLNADLLGTSSYAEDQCDLTVLPCRAGTYILREKNDGTTDFYLLSGDALQLDPVMNEKGIITELYSDFTAAVSFGMLVIF